MAYTPTEWATGDVITAQKLNKMEQGIAGAGLQLYGPYGASASNPSAIDANTAGFVVCDTLEDENGATVVYPATGAMIFLASFSTDARADKKALLDAISLPVYSDGHWADCEVSLINLEGSSKKFYPNIAFYSTVEFPQKS